MILRAGDLDGVKGDYQADTFPSLLLGLRWCALSYSAIAFPTTMDHVL